MDLEELEVGILNLSFLDFQSTVTLKYEDCPMFVMRILKNKQRL